MKDIKDLENVVNEVSTSNLSDKAKKIVLALLSKEIFEIRSMNQRIMDNKTFVDEELNRSK